MPHGPSPLDPLLRPQSIAVVGASERRGSVGDHTLRQLVAGGFDGEVIPVNPRYETLNGLPVAASLEELSRPVDLAVLAVPNSALEAEMEKAAAIGARAAVIFASCHGTAASGVPLRQRIRELAEGIPICGGNGMGFVNVADRVRVCGFYQPENLAPGRVTFLSHSGSLFSAMLHNRREIHFNTVVSTGLELNTAMDAYIEWALETQDPAVIALFLETIRNPDGFRRALSAAEDRDVPIVALKVGASARGSRAVATHSEGIAGDDAVYEALFDAHGVHRVWTMDEMADTIQLLASGRRATAFGVGVVHDSGGERALLIDAADRVGVPLPEIGEATEQRLAAVLDPGLDPVNPVDAWGTGREATNVFSECLMALSDDPAIGAVAFAVDLTFEEHVADSYAGAALNVAGKVDKPLMVIANLASCVDPVQAQELRMGGVPVLEGTETGLRAIRHLLDRHRRALMAPQLPRLTVPADPRPGLGGEMAALDVLAAYGIRTPRRLVAGDAASAAAAAAAIGYPVVMKTASGIGHKTDAGGVALGLDGDDAVVAAYRDVAERLGSKVVVAEQVDDGVEVAVGMVTDRQFGPVVVVSAGGTLIDVLRDRVALLPPVDAPGAMRALDRLAMRPVLDGVRGMAKADLDALAEAIARFSELAVDAAAVWIHSIDVNPIIVSASGAVAVDALMTVAT